MDDVRTRTTIGSPVEVTEIVRGKRPSAVSCAASAGPCCGLFVKLDRGPSACASRLRRSASPDAITILRHRDEAHLAPLKGERTSKLRRQRVSKFPQCAELGCCLRCERDAANVVQSFTAGAVVCASIDVPVAIISISIPMFAPGAGLTAANIGTVAIPNVRHATWPQSSQQFMWGPRI
jgi:hypothetical protein